MKRKKMKKVVTYQNTHGNTALDAWSREIWKQYIHTEIQTKNQQIKVSLKNDIAFCKIEKINIKKQKIQNASGRGKTNKKSKNYYK